MNWEWTNKFKDFFSSKTFDRNSYEDNINDMLHRSWMSDVRRKKELREFINQLEYTPFTEVSDYQETNKNIN